MEQIRLDGEEEIPIVIEHHGSGLDRTESNSESDSDSVSFGKKKKRSSSESEASGASDSESDCPCVLFGRNVETIREEIPWNNACVCHAMIYLVNQWLLVTAFRRCTLSIADMCLSAYLKEYIVTNCFALNFEFADEFFVQQLHPNSPCDPCMVHCCLQWCALCQEHREMKGHLYDSSSMAFTSVNDLQLHASLNDQFHKITSTLPKPDLNLILEGNLSKAASSSSSSEQPESSNPQMV